MAKMNISYKVSITDRFTKPLRKMHAQLESFKRTAERVDNMNITPQVDAHTEKAEDDLDDVNRKAKSIPNLIYIHFASNFKQFNSNIDKMSSMVRNFGVVAQNVGSGALMALSPIGASLGSGLTAAVGGLLPIIGTAAGGVLGLASAFSAAAVGAAGFASVAAPSIGSVIDKTDELATLQERATKARQTGDIEKYNELMSEMERVLGNVSEKQQEAIKATQRFKKFYSEFAKSLEEPVLDVFMGSMRTARNLLERLEPAIRTSTEAVSGLFDSFNAALGAEDVKAIIEWLNTSAAPALTSLGKSAGYLVRGLLSILAAFDPLAKDMQEGLLGMTKRFSEWAAGLSESERFNAFLDYVRENGPKLLKIFGNITDGLVGMGEAFAPFASKMLDGLVDLTDRFEEWGKNLKNDKGFQEWIDRVVENGPEMMSFIENMVDFLKELGKGFSAVGEQIMPVVNSFLEWVNTLMENNPWIAKAVAWFFSLTGVVKILAPLIAVLVSALRLVWPVFKLIWNGLKWAWNGFTKLLNILKPFKSQIIAGLRVGGSAILRFLTGPIGLLIQGVIMLAILIYKNWDSIWATTKNIFTKVLGFLASTWYQIRLKFFIAKQIAKLIWNKFTEIRDNVIEKMTAVWNKIKTVWNSITSAFNKAKEIAKTVKTKFNEIKRAISEKMEAAESTVDEIIENIKGLFDLDLFESGKAIVQSAIDGIKSMKSSATSAVGEVAGAIRDFWPFSPAKRGPLSDLNKVDFGGPIADSIKNAKSPAERAAQNTANAIRKPFDKMDTQFDFKARAASVPRRGQQTQPAEAAAAGGAQAPAQPLYMTFQLGDEDYDAFIDDVNKRQGQKIKTTKRRKGVR
ncbi:hypothetical protein [Thalassobacillus sp. CUG 92003]|uniref:phage tail protein n=1 Tax=Thalassobacillus sp. CUG 92003 TaxID=2736641 RepID=UPI0015E6E97E|nr:hypothetical protein [Thalassobacillus sp. CUG 92003]